MLVPLRKLAPFVVGIVLDGVDEKPELFIAFDSELREVIVEDVGGGKKALARRIVATEGPINRPGPDLAYVAIDAWQVSRCPQRSHQLGGDIAVDRMDRQDEGNVTGGCFGGLAGFLRELLFELYVQFVLKLCGQKPRLSRGMLWLPGRAIPLGPKFTEALLVACEDVGQRLFG